MEDNQPALDDDAELMQALGQEVRTYFDEQLQTLHARLDVQQQLLVALKDLQTALVSPRVIVSDDSGKPIGVRILS
jgi:hypothetical protein